MSLFHSRLSAIKFSSLKATSCQFLIYLFIFYENNSTCIFSESCQYAVMVKNLNYGA